MIKYFITTIFCSLFWVLPNAMGQVLPPTDFCANVEDDGSVMLSWVPPSPIGDVVSYTIYKFDGTSYVNINTTLDESVAQYPDFTGDPLSEVQQYYIVSNGSSGGMSVQVSISTIFLEVDAIDDFSVASLEWNSPINPTPAGASITLERKIDGIDLDFVAINTLPGPQVAYKDTLYGLCTPSDDIKIKVDYRIVFNYGTCNMHSNIEFDEFKDKLAPEIPVVETVSVDPFTGEYTVYWYPVSDPDLRKYVIQQYVSVTTAFDIDSVFVGDATEFTFTDPPDPPANGGISMQIISYDECENEQSTETRVSTMFVRTTYQTCDTTGRISWNPYEGWDEGVEGYTLYISENGGTFTDTTYVDGNVTEYFLETTPNSEYCVYVEATSNGDQIESTSNMTCFTAQYPEPADFNYISRVSTESDNEIVIELLQDANSKDMTYELWRSVSGSTFRYMATYDQTNGQPIVVSDFDVDADIKVYTYYWKAFDGCGLELAESNRSNNIVLNAETSNIGLANVLSWNAYEGWDGGVLGYDIYRKLGSETEFTLHQSLGPDVFTYREDVESYMLEEGLFCYKVVAVEGSNSFGNSAESVSNEACATQEPLMWIPNAIVTNGFNNVFAPVAGFINFQSYQMEIRNKAGLILFETDKVEEGWDGTYKGHLIGEDYYMYIIAYRDGAGQNYVERGVVYVLHGGAN